VENLTVPVRGMFVLMLVFSIAIGPVNLYVLARKRRRLWMLWTVPVISLLTCLGVLGYMYASEGWDAYVRSEGITVVDESAHQATTLGWLGFYAPLVPSDGLNFSQQTELTAQLRGGQNWPRSRTMDWSLDQHLVSGWLTARVPAHFVVRSTERRLERVLVRKRPDGMYVMTNGLKADIHDIGFMSQSGKVYAADNVAAGQEAALTPGGASLPPAKIDSLREIYKGEWLKGIRDAGKNPETLLRPGCYVATLDSAPFMEPGLRQAGHRQGYSVVFGVMKEPIED